MTSTSENKYPQIYQRYILLDAIGAGGMGQVFRAVTMDEINRVVVVKKTFEHLRSNSSYVKMFRDEIKVLSLLNHPNIVHLYSYGSKAEFIEMEYVRGLSLNQILLTLEEKKEKIPIEIAVYIAHEAAKGLSYAHELRDDAKSLPLGIVHRDISPHNLMISAKGSVKILDFGISKFTDQLNVTEFGVVKGKRHYIAPEQNRGETVNASADIYSLGAVLWRMLVGEPPFDADNQTEYRKIVVESEIKAPSIFNSQVPKTLDAVCQKALQYRPENRFKTMEEFQTELLAVSKEINRENSIVRKTSDWILANFKSQLVSEEDSLRTGLNTAASIAKSARETQDKTILISSSPLEPSPEKVLPKSLDLLKWKIPGLTVFLVFLIIAGFKFFGSEKDNQGNRTTSTTNEVKKENQIELSDLHLLVEQQFYEEALGKLAQIPITQRLDSWRQLVVRTVIGWLEKKAAGDNNSAFEEIKSLELKFPFILENADYSKLKSKIVLAWLDACATTDSNCLNTLLPVANADPNNADLAFELGKKATFHYFHYHALPFFKIALQRKNDKTYCHDDRLKSALSTGLTFSKDTEIRKLADDVTQLCR
tara:strand:+ start:2631 stop:4409 length:1779 start_codon:yes stop_codon:yes gene_type:complete